MECNKMSNGLTAWAQKRPLNNRNMKDLLVWLASVANDQNAVTASKTAIIANVPDINTVGQADRALRGLMDGGYVSSRYDHDSFTHVYTLHA